MFVIVDLCRAQNFGHRSSQPWNDAGGFQFRLTREPVLSTYLRIALLRHSAECFTQLPMYTNVPMQRWFSLLWAYNQYKNELSG
jgi:hypothetical protein